MKIALISPKGPLYRHRGGIFRKSLRYAPLTLTTLASLVPEDLNADITLVDEGIEDVDMALSADVVGLTVITGTAPRAYALSRHFRSRGIPVVMGGPHVTLVPEDAEPYADSVVVGYAEDTWPELLRDLAAGRLRPRYTQQPDLSLAGRPFPRRDLLPARRFLTTNVFEATRGCIHNCEFCVVPSAWGRKPYQKPAAEVAADIRQHGARKAIFVDLNLIADRDYAVDLFTALAPLDIEWYGLSTVLIAGDLPLLDLAARSGCRGLLIGFESLVNENVRGSGKVFNRRMTPEALRDCCRDARRAFYGPTSIVRRMTNLRANARTPSHLGLFLAANLVSRREIASKLGRPLGARPGRQPTDAARAVPIRTAPAAVVSVGTRVKEESS